MKSKILLFFLGLSFFLAPLAAFAQSSPYADLFDKEAHGFTGNSYDAEAIAKEIDSYLKANDYTIEDGILSPEERLDFNEYILNSGGHRTSIVLEVAKEITGAYTNRDYYDKGDRTTYPLFFRNDSLVLGQAYWGKARSGKGKEYYITAWFEVPFDMLKRVRIVKKSAGPLQKIQFLIFSLTEIGTMHVSSILGKNTSVLIFCAPGFDTKGKNYEALQQLMPMVEIINEL